MDEFKITNYRNKTILPKDLYEFAQHYVDTVHADKPVSSVDFVGEKPCEDLPEDPVEDPFNIEQKRFLIGFGFDNFMGKNAVKTNIELHDISISRAGKTKIYYLHFADDKHIADSILSSKELFDSDF